MYWDNKNKVIILLILVILILVVFLITGWVRDYNQQQISLAYQQGVTAATIQIQQNMINQLNNFGFYSVNLPADNNQTINLRLMPQQQISPPVIQE